MNTILLTLSPSNALQMLNGKQIVSSFKVPLGTAYVYVGKYGHTLNTFISSGKQGYVIDDYGLGAYGLLTGKVVAKCEITACEASEHQDAHFRWFSLYYPKITALTVFDKPMELKEFQSATELDRKYRAYAKVGCKVGTYRVVPKENYADLGIARLTRAPSRWQAVIAPTAQKESK